MARICVVDCGSTMLCRKLAVAQCLTVNLAATSILMGSRSRMFMLSMQRTWALRCPPVWVALAVRRADRRIRNIPCSSDCHLYLPQTSTKQLLIVAAYTTIWSLEPCRDRCADQYKHSRSDPALNPLVMPGVLLVLHAP